MQRNILEYLEHTVKRVPDKTAFANGEMGMSFQEVFDASRSIGTCLIEKGYAKPIRADLYLWECCFMH